MFSPRYQQRKAKQRQQLMSALENLTLTIAALTAIVDNAVQPHATDAQVQAAAAALAAQTTRLNTANGTTPAAA
jgi:phosphoribosyl-dephospho-CoA transferase